MRHDPYASHGSNHRSGRGSGILRGIAFLVLVGIFGFVFFSPRGPHEPRQILIPRGMAASQVVDTLGREGVVRYPSLLKSFLRFTGGTNRVRAGEFRFKTNSRLLEALYVLYYSEPIYHQVTIPEGWSIRQIAPILAREKLIDEKKFVSLALDRETAKKFKITAPSLEGFLYPDTYKFSRVDGEQRILERMVQGFMSRFDPNIQARATQLGMTREQVVTLASIVEKETGVPQEREVIASVFHNRLKKKMRLQSDPTTIYGIANFNGNLTKKDLLTPTPYNTYTIYGLPPGPIASPGISAIRAVLYPATSNYLYFVANNRGSHLFSETYAQHAKYVDDYQRSAASRRATGSQKSPKQR